MSRAIAHLLPEHLISAYDLSMRTVEKIRLLESYDLSKISDNLVDKGPKYSPEQVWPLRLHFGTVDAALARTLEIEFKRFIALSLMRPRNIYAPSGPVDMFWHFFVLHTREYEIFCDDLWGKAQEAPYPEAVREGYNQSDRKAVACPITDLVPASMLSKVDEHIQGQLRVLAGYDLSYFTEHLVDEGRLFAPEQKYPIIAHFGRCDLEVTRELELEFRRFVALTLLDPVAVFAPPGAVDMYWHFLVLHTKEYRHFCDAIWGSFQHHPRGSRD